jgi:hypothetical protein
VSYSYSLSKLSVVDAAAKAVRGSITGEFVGVGACEEYETNLPTQAPEASRSVGREAAKFL